jgi:hypothetical protein
VKIFFMRLECGLPARLRGNQVALDLDAARET